MSSRSATTNTCLNGIDARTLAADRLSAMPRQPKQTTDLPSGRSVRRSALDDADARPVSQVLIVLTPTQIRQVLRQTGQGATADLLALIERFQGSAGAAQEDSSGDKPRLSRSLVQGLVVLSCFKNGEELRVLDVATRCDMSPSTAHRYLSTLVATGLLEQIPRTRRYQLAQ